MKEDYNTENYKIDFPDEGTWNWKKVKISNCDNAYYNNHIAIGVVLHDGNFVKNGVMFEKHEFTIINDNPFDSIPKESTIEKQETVDNELIAVMESIIDSLSSTHNKADISYSHYDVIDVFELAKQTLKSLNKKEK